MIALIPVARARGLTEIDCPKAMVATALTVTRRGVSGLADSTSSLGARSKRPKLRKYRSS